MNKLKIPKKLKVGYVNREDTYTGKLAYVTYVDEKGTHRKKRSWDGWRDHKISADDYENEPTSGFVLNKKAGDHRYGWNGRIAAIRVFDPRGFEFEIKLDNLLFILQETSAVKGKGLDGDFVYAWDGANHVLLPTTSMEYEDSMKFTSLQTNKIGKKDMVVGATYLTKKSEEVMYLGREVWYEPGKNKEDNWVMKTQKKHVFVFVEERETTWESEYWLQTGFTQLAAVINPEPASNFPDEYDEFRKTVNGSPPSKFIFRKKKFKKMPLNISSYNRQKRLLKKGDKYYPCAIGVSGKYNEKSFFYLYTSPWDIEIDEKKFTVDFQELHSYNFGSGYYEWNRNVPKPGYVKITAEEIKDLDTYSLQIKNEAGGIHTITKD